MFDIKPETLNVNNMHQQYFKYKYFLQYYCMQDLYLMI